MIRVICLEERPIHYKTVAVIDQTSNFDWGKVGAQANQAAAGAGAQAPSGTGKGTGFLDKVQGAVGKLQQSGALDKIQSMRQGANSPCGNKPLFGKQKKQAWQDCMNNQAAQSAGAGASTSFNPSPAPTGMSTGAKIGIAIGVAVLLGVGIYFATRKKK